MEGSTTIPTTVPGERMPPIYFAGRTKELRQFDEHLRALCATGESDGLHLVVGVPGSGKTRLAREFERRVDGRVVDHRTISALTISVRELGHPLTLFKTIARAIDAEQEAGAIAQIDDRVANVSGSVLGSSVAVAKDVGRHTSAFAGLLRESNDKGMWNNKALVLLVDELQAIDANAISTLQVLHEGLSGCPILLVGFGLNHTAARLASFPDSQGISRIATPVVLQSLDVTETYDVFDKTLEQLGHRDVPAKSMDELVEASQGFPQHVNGYLNGAHRALLQHGHLEGKSIEEALRYGGERRVDYYNQRLATEHLHRPMTTLVAAMEQDRPTPLNYHDALKLLEQAGFGKRELEGAIAHGALSCDSDDRVSFGIPSFHSYMVDLLAKERRR